MKRLLSRFAKRVALYTSLSIKHDTRIRLSARMPYVPILDERILLALEEAFKPSKMDARWRLKSVRLEFLIAALRTECVGADLSHGWTDVSVVQDIPRDMLQHDHPIQTNQHI